MVLEQLLIKDKVAAVVGVVAGLHLHRALLMVAVLDMLLRVLVEAALAQSASSGPARLAASHQRIRGISNA
jgi:hypothetical protein